MIFCWDRNRHSETDSDDDDDDILFTFYNFENCSVDYTTIFKIISYYLMFFTNIINAEVCEYGCLCLLVFYAETAKRIGLKFGTEIVYSLN